MKAIFAASLLLGASHSVLGQPMKAVGTLTADMAEPGKAPTVTCQSLASLHFPGIKITRAILVSAAPPASASAEGRPITLPAHCVATANIKSIAGSSFKMELWMPSRDWNAKLVTVGNAGAGDAHDAMGDALRRGYAVATMDNGYSGPGAIHDAVLKAKALAGAFYGAAPRYSYWTGSSYGGAQGLQAVQTYPADFDGVVVGAPASEEAAVGGNAAATDVSAFAARGGKIIQYQGWPEPVIPANQSTEYFERVAFTQGDRQRTASFYRLFLIPAVELANGSYSIDWLSPLEEWVERGRAPASVLANHIPPPNAVIKPPPPGAVVFEPAYGVRVMCAYPSIARLQGGLGEVPVDWICVLGP